MKNKVTITKIGISGLVLLSFMAIYSLFAVFKNIDHPDNWRFYCSALGFIWFSSFLVFAIFRIIKNK